MTNTVEGERDIAADLNWALKTWTFEGEERDIFVRAEKEIQSLRAQLTSSKEQEEHLASLLSLATISPEEHEDVKRQLAEKEKEATSNYKDLVKWRAAIP